MWVDRLDPTPTCLRKTGHFDVKLKIHRKRDTAGARVSLSNHRSTSTSLKITCRIFNVSKKKEKKTQTLVFSKGEHVISVAMVTSTDPASILRVRLKTNVRKDWEATAKTHRNSHREHSCGRTNWTTWREWMWSRADSTTTCGAVAANDHVAPEIKTLIGES